MNDKLYGWFISFAVYSYTNNRNTKIDFASIFTGQ